MKAIVQDHYGFEDSLGLGEVDTPPIKDDEVLVRVHAASVHVGDWMLMTGVPRFMRLATGLRRPRNVDMVRSIGADHVIDYTKEDFTKGGPRYDFILDNVGNHSLSATRRALTPSGRLLPNGGGHSGGALGNLIKAHLSAFFIRQQARPAIKFQNPADLVALKTLVETGKVVPVLDASYPLLETPRAVGHVGDGHARGTVVITVPASTH